MMTWKKSIAILIVMLLSSIVHADTTVYYAPGPPGLLTPGTAGKKAGDIISLLTDDAIAAYCNFDKQIVVTRTSVLCIYNGKS
jgi:hypothetical protein